MYLKFPPRNEFASSMFEEDKTQPCKDCGKEYILENLMTGRSWEWWLCIRCYNKRKNEKIAKAETRQRKSALGQDCVA